MKHITTNNSDHWAVSKSSNHKDLLLQVQENGNQSRIVLPIAHAKYMLKVIQNCIEEIEELNAAQKANGI